MDIFLPVLDLVTANNESIAETIYQKDAIGGKQVH